MNGDRLELTDLAEIRDLLFRSPAMRLRVAGWSMYPTLWPGDRLTAEPVPLSHLRVGDLLLISHRGRVICHRLTVLEDTRTAPRLVAKGDAQGGRGEAIEAGDVLGRVVAVRRRWPWVRASGRAGALAMRVDRARRRLSQRIARTLERLQGVRGYRCIIRALSLPSFDFYLGVSDGRRWFDYRRIGGGGPLGRLDRHRLHLVAKRAGAWVGGVRVTRTEDGHRIDDLYVRVRYRGMGVGSTLLALAATAARRSGSAALRASVEPANTVALELFRKAGFCRTTGDDGHSIRLRRDVQGSEDSPRSAWYER
jgi:ribosomal protein S18 acetylase RimI-like enzyme